MPLEDAAFGRHFVPDDGPAAEVLARKRAATYQRLTMQLTLEAAARFVAAADVSTDSGQSAASGYRVLLVCAASRLGWRCRVWVAAVLVLFGLVFCVCLCSFSLWTRSMPLEDAAFGRHFVPDDGPAAEVLARKRAATYQRLTHAADAGGGRPRFVAAADVSTDSGQSAASGYRVLLVCAASRLGWRCRVWVAAVLVLFGLVFCV
ncbi:hypothetical protein GUITHDRAFT_121842 [Guillardia theta CCMP2712]|uniref:Uncharacterized protein n=1 Tax=Guillardia theta (strain CCMP2712) TaxID=905079 RepID=L1I6U8_GUITC|nr:hypothetical protein GUITHDRAFT_121842 [Guillardia theta CCMP2712]EKX31971.1 hypothetical protein GUITHDRAFT_121842 [Guillardia theta CCMP2712]|eukprot:XP_005818951.1 hypothetical protein GUITHDRAFT_121842 [Guillardia theta CCMP2712]